MTDPQSKRAKEGKSASLKCGPKKGWALFLRRVKIPHWTGFTGSMMPQGREYWEKW